MSRRHGAEWCIRIMNESIRSLTSRHSLSESPLDVCMFVLWQCDSPETWKARLSKTLLYAATFQCKQTCIDVGVVFAGFEEHL